MGFEHAKSMFKMDSNWMNVAWLVLIVMSIDLIIESSLFAMIENIGIEVEEEIENDKEIELVRNDSTWSISQVDSLIVKENQIDKIFDRLLKVEKEILITSKEEKWEKFGVDDSLARHIQVFDENDNEILHYLFGNSG